MKYIQLVTTLSGDINNKTYNYSYDHVLVILSNGIIYDDGRYLKRSVLFYQLKELVSHQFPVAADYET